MDIIFDYQPIELMTRFTVNGVVRSDLFGELGAVSRYPLQSWLWKRGPWMGLRKVLQDVARNRQMEITFIGREMDFRDFERVVNGMEKTTLRFQPAYEELFALQLPTDQLSPYIETHPDMQVRETYRQLLSAKPAGRFYRVETVEQYREVEDRIQAGRLVALLAADVFWELKKELTDMLRENFMRPGESIVVLAGNSQEKIVLGEELGNMGISVAEEDDGLIEHLIEKYSVPEIASENTRICTSLASLLGFISKRYEGAKEENHKIRLRMHQDLTTDEETEHLDGKYNTNLVEIKWFEAYRKKIGEDLASLDKATENC